MCIRDRGANDALCEFIMLGLKAVFVELLSGSTFCSDWNTGTEPNSGLFMMGDLPGVKLELVFALNLEFTGVIERSTWLSIPGAVEL